MPHRLISKLYSPFLFLHSFMEVGGDGEEEEAVNSLSDGNHEGGADDITVAGAEGGKKKVKSRTFL